MTPVLGILAALLTIACAAVLVRVHMLATGYNPVSNAVSDYGVGEYRRYYRWQTAALAYAALVLAAALARTTHPVPELIIFLLMTFAAARLLIPSFPTDLDRGRPTPTGRLHIALAAVPSRPSRGGRLRCPIESIGRISTPRSSSSAGSSPDRQSPAASA